LLASLAALVLSGGCGPIPAQPAPPSQPAQTSQTSAPAEVGLKLVKLDQLQAALGEHKGKVVLLDVWSVT
jgi:thiol:disulfide interchange protein